MRIVLALAISLIAVRAGACDYPAGPPDAEAATAEGDGVTWAYFSDAVDGFDHAVLGDNIEARGLRVMTATTGPCDTFVYLGENSVFEDITPRIADVTGDGLNDVIVIETRFDAGASLAVYGVVGERLEKVAATPHIGQPSRWLAPAGIADFDGDGVKDVAYVDRPHIGGVLRFWSFRDGVARELGWHPGFSNHRIGENFITGGVRDCGRGPEVVLPDFGWRKLMAARLDGGAVATREIAFDTRPETIELALACEAVQ